MNLSVILPAATPLKRGKSYGPIPTINLPNGKSLICQQIDSIRSVYPNSEIILVVGFECDKVHKTKPSKVVVIENELYHQNNVTRSVAMGLRQCHFNNVLIINGDIVFDTKMIESINTHQSSVVVNTPTKHDIGVNILNGNVVSWGFGLQNKWEKIVYLQGKELDLFRKQVFDRNKSNFFLYEILSNITNHNGNFIPIKKSGLLKEMDEYIDSFM